MGLLVSFVSLAALVAVASASHGSYESLLPNSTTTCQNIDDVKISCVDVGMGCNDTTIAAQEQAEAGLTVYICREGLNCQLPPPGNPAPSPYQCAVTARIGELCGCSTLDRNCASLGCYESDYSVSCLNALCRGQNVYGAGEPVSFSKDGVCDRSSNAPFPNGGCLSYADVTLSLICESTTGHCSSLSNGDSCATKPNWCPYDSYCNIASQVCTPRALTASAACNFTTDGAHGCGPLMNCRPDDTCAEWFSGQAGAKCSTLVDCSVGLHCNGATGECAEKPVSASCTHPNGNECTAGTACVCDGASGSCESPVVTAQLLQRWEALTQCVSTNKCFPVSYLNGPVSPDGLQFFPGGCYDTFCRKEWLALQEDEAFCPTSMGAVNSVSVTLLLVAAIFTHLM